MERTDDPRPFMLPRHTSVVDVALLPILDGHLLWSRRANTGFMDGRFGLVAGHLEAGEDVLTATIRESAEEIGIRLHPDHLHCVHVQHRRTPEGLSRIDFHFLTTRWDGDIVNAEPHKCSELRWYPLHQPPPDAIPFSADAVHAITRNQFFSVHGW
ncbi:NUDIX hydrolase [Nocardia sp. alder85J]|uniref:NUDIX hydrolase n=1 Tax=Nocardia sp. alder85J TaxID=2862949 RepID=UPI001CD197F4|nr:NUDIX domain-containing protein [Nocardia sp. alder85J]MCX4097758.1 NUDIX domain-containing protein [Nocardia sp. alder85J]